jgi:surfactin synthase thioesterase subunit
MNEARDRTLQPEAATTEGPEAAVQVAEPTVSGDPWIPWCKPEQQAQFRLFCLPSAGRGASMYLRWVRIASPEVEVCPIQLPGRENRFSEPPINRMAMLVKALSHAIRPYLDRPFAVLGHSMGALIGFELVRHIRQQLEIEPAYLFVAAHRAPQLPDRLPPIAHLPRDKFLDELHRAYGAPAPSPESAELVEVLMPLLRADFELCETYMYAAGEPLDCPITAFGGLDDATVDEEELNGWRQQTRSSFTYRSLAGDHFFIDEHPKDALRSIRSDLMAVPLASAQGQLTRLGDPRQPWKDG